MKFGKTLLAAMEASKETIDPDLWMDYKKLKKQLKSLALLTAAVEIKQGEHNFFVFFQSELKKVELKFQELIAEARSKSAHVLSPSPSSKTDVKTEQVECMDAHMYVLLVENYAVLNYCAFAKILKKHDKCTNRATREKVMGKAVNNLKFADVRELRDLLVRIEQHFNAKRDDQSNFPSVLLAKSPRHRTLQSINTGLSDRLSELATVAAEVAGSALCDDGSKSDSQNSHDSAKNAAKRRRQTS